MTRQIPRSALPDMRWPAIVEGPAAEMLGLQYQFMMTERLAADELAERQFSQLAALLAHCDRTMPFHRERLRAVDYQAGRALDADGWTRVPILARADVVAAGSRLHCLSVPDQHGRTMRGAIPGPGGRPMTILATGLHAFFNDAFMLRDLLWHETDFRGKWARIAHDPATAAAGAKGTREKDWGPAISTAFATGPAVGFDAALPVAEQAAWLARERPDFLSAPPDTLAALAGFLRDRNQKPPRLKALRCDGVAPADLALLCRDVFGHTPIMAAILPEIGCLALQCPEHGSLHVMAEGVLVEILTAEGAACATGQRGRLVATPLHNFAMPLLRYDTGLLAEPGPHCACGRTLPVVRRIIPPPA